MELAAAMTEVLLTRRRAREIAGISRPTEQRWLRDPSLNPSWPRPLPPVVQNGLTHYLASEIQGYIEARVAARDAAQASAGNGSKELKRLRRSVGRPKPRRNPGSLR
jgi:hypothetical protein